MKLIKKLKTIGLGIVLASLTLVSCEKAGSTPPPPAQPTNYFSYLGNTYELDAGCITPDGADNFIVLYSSGISLNAAKDDFIGTGDGISFSVYGTGVLGSYTYDSTITDPALPGEFDDSEFAIQSNSATNTSVLESEVVGGNITIAAGTSGGYVIDMTGTSAQGNPIVVHYEGLLTAANVH